MERSEIRVSQAGQSASMSIGQCAGEKENSAGREIYCGNVPCCESAPDFASLHPGYKNWR
jgi:hypothetical protein